MCNHLNLKILIHILPIVYLILIIIMRGENFVAHLDGLGGTPVCRGTPVAYHCPAPQHSWRAEKKNAMKEIAAHHLLLKTF
jgi:hypothetical protein